MTPRNVLHVCPNCEEWRHETQFRFRGDKCDECRYVQYMRSSTEDLIAERQELSRPGRNLFVVSRGSTFSVLLDSVEEK